MNATKSLIILHILLPVVVISMGWGLSSFLESEENYQKKLPQTRLASQEACLKSIQSFYPDTSLVKYGNCEYLLKDGRFVYCQEHNQVCGDWVFIKVPK